MSSRTNSCRGSLHASCSIYALCTLFGDDLKANYHLDSCMHWYSRTLPQRISNHCNRVTLWCITRPFINQREAYFRFNDFINSDKIVSTSHKLLYCTRKSVYIHKYSLTQYRLVLGILYLLKASCIGSFQIDRILTLSVLKCDDKCMLLHLMSFFFVLYHHCFPPHAEGLPHSARIDSIEYIFTTVLKWYELSTNNHTTRSMPGPEKWIC